MANFYTEIPELKYHLNNPMMKRICELKERNYRDKDEFDYAPLDFEDALDSYDKVLEITGEITGEIINANAEGVDEEGPHCANGRVEYASGTKENLDAMVKAGLNGMTMPRRFGTPCVLKSLPLPMQVSETSGLCRTVSKHCMNSVMPTSTAVSSLAYARAKRCLWTSPNRMPVPTFRQ